MEDAILDVATRDPSSGQPLFLDATVTCSNSIDPARQLARSRRNGAGAEDAARDKQHRFPGGTLTAVALEAHGRPAEETVAFIRRFGAAALEKYPSRGLGSVWQGLSTTLQVGNAEMLLSALV